MLRGKRVRNGQVGSGGRIGTTKNAQTQKQNRTCCREKKKNVTFGRREKEGKKVTRETNTTTQKMQRDGQSKFLDKGTPCWTFKNN